MAGAFTRRGAARRPVASTTAISGQIAYTAHEPGTVALYASEWGSGAQFWTRRFHAVTGIAWFTAADRRALCEKIGGSISKVKALVTWPASMRAPTCRRPRVWLRKGTPLTVAVPRVGASRPRIRRGGGLAGSVGAEETGDLSRSHGEGQPVDGGPAAVAFGEFVDFDHRVDPAGMAPSGDGAVGGNRAGAFARGRTSAARFREGGGWIVSRDGCHPDHLVPPARRAAWPPS